MHATITAADGPRYAFPGLPIMAGIIKKHAEVSVVGIEDFIRAAGTDGPEHQALTFLLRPHDRHLSGPLRISMAVQADRESPDDATSPSDTSD